MKSHLVGARLSDKEYKVFQVIMTRDNLTPSEAIRSLIREGAAKRGIYAVGMVEILSKYEVKNGKEI